MLEFDGKVVVIAGAAGNLGAAATRAFEKQGAILAPVDRSGDQLKEIFPDIALNNKHLLIPCVDMTDPEMVKETVKVILERFGTIDVLVSVVGGFRAGSPLHETPVETLEFLFRLNTQTFYIACQLVLPIMIEGGGGKIIGVGARPGITGQKDMAAYSASKSGLIRLTESMAAEYKSQNINVNCVIPGTLDTPQNRSAMPEADFSDWVQPESLADVILFLCSDKARDIHGASIPVLGHT